MGIGREGGSEAAEEGDDGGDAEEGGEVEGVVGIVGVEGVEEEGVFIGAGDQLDGGAVGGVDDADAVQRRVGAVGGAAAEEYVAALDFGEHGVAARHDGEVVVGDVRDERSEVARLAIREAVHESRGGLRPVMWPPVRIGRSHIALAGKEVVPVEDIRECVGDRLHQAERATLGEILKRRINLRLSLANLLGKLCLCVNYTFIFQIFKCFEQSCVISIHNFN